MNIIKTEKKYWYNGKTVHGKNFWQYAFSCFGCGVIINRPYFHKEDGFTFISIYKLI